MFYKINFKLRLKKNKFLKKSQSKSLMQHTKIDDENNKLLKQRNKLSLPEKRPLNKSYWQRQKYLKQIIYSNGTKLMQFIENWKD